MAPRTRPALTLDSAELGRFAGSYQSPQLGVATMRFEGDHLAVSSAAFSEMDFYPASRTVFFPLSGGVPEITFLQDEHGEVTAAAAGSIRAVKLRSAK